MTDTQTTTDRLAEVLEALLGGVTECGMHEDNSTELFDIDGANETMSEAADLIQSQQAEIERLREALEDVCDYGDLAAVRVARAALNPQPGKGGV